MSTPGLLGLPFAGFITNISVMRRNGSPELFVGYSGVVVEAAPWYWPQTPIAGLPDFLDGVVSRSGVEVSGILSARKGWRRPSVVRGIAKAGLTEFFPDPSTNHTTVDLTGSEVVKAKRLAARANGGVVGMLDDHPEKVGPALIRAMIAHAPRSYVDDASPAYNTHLTRPRRHAVLGVASGPESQDRMKQFLERAPLVADNIEVVDSAFGDSQIIQTDGRGFDIETVMLPPFSATAGEEFADRLQMASNY